MLPFLPFLLVGFLLALAGWGGLAYLFLYTLPTLVYRWLFFFFLSLALSGTILPLVHFLHRRFPSTPPSEAGVIVREAVLFGLYGGILAWLQLGRVLNPSLGVFVAAGIIIVELIIRLRERSRFKPSEETPGE